MKRKIWIILLLAVALLVSISTVSAFEFALPLAAQADAGFIDKIIEGSGEVLGKVGTQMTADAISNMLSDGMDKVLLWLGIRKTPTFWEEYKTTIVIGLIGIAVLIGMIIYDRSKTRGRTQYRRSRRGSNSFDDNDTDIFGDGRESVDFDQPRASAQRRSSGGASGGLRLVGLEGDYAGQSIPLSRETLTIGRSRDCSLVMRNYVKGISKTHCAIRFSASRGAYQIMDMGSTYGTYVNGKKIAPKTAKTLNRNDVINLGSKRVGFRVS